MKYEKLYQNIHLIEVQNLIREENRHKAGIYMILNLINNKKYIGSAASNRINVRFRNHLIHGTGSKPVALAVKKYGIENFNFYILEYFPGFVKKENLNSAHLSLLKLETSYIQLYHPEYNILQEANSSLGYSHTKETKQHLRDNFSLERKEKIGNLNRGKTFTTERRQLLSEIAKLRNSNQNLRDHLSKIASKPVTLYFSDGTVHSKYSGIRTMAKAFGCCNKTINKAIKNKSIFRDIGIIKLDQT